MQNLRLFGAAVRVVGMGFLTGSLGFVGIPACAQRVPNQPSASSRSEVHPPQPGKPARCVSDCAKHSPDAGAVGGNEAPQTAAVAAVEFNFCALEARILNPYDAKATVSSPPPTHHVTANFDEDLSLDLVNMAGSVGREVWFKAEALAPATAVRGRVLRWSSTLGFQRHGSSPMLGGGATCTNGWPRGASRRKPRVSFEVLDVKLAAIEKPKTDWP